MRLLILWKRARRSKENGLEVIEEILPVSARVIVNMASMKLRREEIDAFW